MAGKGGHGEGGRFATGELNIDDLMIDHVIVAAVNAAAVLPVAQCSEEILLTDVRREYAQKTLGRFMRVAEVDLFG